MRKYKIDFKRVFVNVSLIFIMFICFNLICNFTLGTKHINTENITVSSNDTLWKIASQICEKSDTDLNVQNVILEIKDMNNLKSSTIYCGQEILVPVYQ